MIQEGYSVPYSDDMYPNKDNVIKMIKRQNQTLDSDDLFIFFYAGHGQTGPSGEMFLATGYDSTSYSKLGITDLLVLRGDKGNHLIQKDLIGFY